MANERAQASPTPALQHRLPPDRSSRSELVGVAMYLVAALMFALNGSLAKLVLNVGLPPLRITELRNAGAFALLAIFVLFTNRKAFRIRSSELWFLIQYGVIAFAVVQFLYFATIALLPVGVGTLLGFLAPVIVALWIRFGRKQPVNRRLWLAIALTLIGLALVAQVWNGLQLNPVGVLCGVALAIALAAYFLLGESGQETRDPISLTMWGFFFATVTYSVIAPWWTFPWATLFEPTAPIADGWPAFDVWQVGLYTIVFGTVLPFLLVLASLRRIGAQRASIVGTTEPIWAFGIAYLVVGETVTSVQLVGAFIVLFGVVIAETSRA